jgi:polyribonucleotide nucleotidyltransferase
MHNAKTIAAEIHGKQIIFESGLLALQAAGSVTVRLGDTIVFSAVTTKAPREGCDFFPLQVEYREKSYAAGKFPGGFFKREGRPSEREILTARMTDRPIRSLFPDGFRDEVQINNSMLCTDAENDSMILSMNAASAALVISELPFNGPIGAVRVGRVDGKFVINPTHTEMEKSDLDLVYVGTRELPMMIEGAAAEISEADMVAAMKFGHDAIIPIIDAQLELRKALGLPEKQYKPVEIDMTMTDKLRELIGTDLQSALMIAGKLERQEKVTAIKEAGKAKLLEQFPEMTASQFGFAFDMLEIELVRKNVLENNRRIDGRAFDELRPLKAQVGLLPRTHGSALFNRGETQALATITLGTKSDVQEMDDWAGGPDEKNFMLHYNFPPYSVGEVGRLGGVGRREIGHGALAERSLREVMPKDYPYTVRVVSEIMGSNGSSSMASVCVGCLALMDAGIPISRTVAGISIGLFTAPGKSALVTDILGAEDHCGDMDFKVAGTRNGITGFQVDLKMHGLDWDLVAGAFEQAKNARTKILDYMESVIAKPREELSPFAPRITVLKINPEKIGLLIGPGGKNIRRITDTLDVQIDIEDDGSVHIFSTNKESMDAAVKEVSLVAAEAEVGKIYRGTVTGIKDFGAFVEILPGKEGLVHISELANFRVKRVEDVVKMNEQIWVKCINVDDNGKVRLSRKAALEEKDAQSGE